MKSRFHEAADAELTERFSITTQKLPAWVIGFSQLSKRQRCGSSNIQKSLR